MLRTQRVVLRKGLRFRRVVVESLTLARYLDLRERAGERAVRLKIELRRDITEQDIYRSMTPEDYVTLADILCPGERRGFFRAFSTPTNEGRLLAAFIVTNDWNAIGESVHTSMGPRKTGTLEGDLWLVCERTQFRYMPWELMARYVDEFLLLCRGVRDAHAPDEPSDEVAPLSVLSTVPGVEVVH